MAEGKGTVVKRKRRRTIRRRFVVDSVVRNAAALSDGCNPELVRGAAHLKLAEQVMGIVRLAPTGTECRRCV